MKLFAAMLHEEKAMIAQHRIPDDTTEVTQVKELLDPVDLESAVVTADAAHACRETAEYIAGRKEDGGRESDYFVFVKGTRRDCSGPSLTPSSRTPRATPITLSWTAATAGSSAAPSGSPPRTAPASRTPAGQPASAVTAMTATAS